MKMGGQVQVECGEPQPPFPSCSYDSGGQVKMLQAEDWRLPLEKLAIVGKTNNIQFPAWYSNSETQKMVKILIPTQLPINLLNMTGESKTADILRKPPTWKTDTQRNKQEAERET